MKWRRALYLVFLLAVGATMAWLTFTAMPAKQVWAAATWEPQPDDRLCLGCHEVDKGIEAHREDANACLRCHAPHSVVHLPETVRPTAGGCTVCHYEYSPATLGERKDISVHSPVREGRCRDCHTLHAPGEESKFIMPEEKLCFTCHRQMQGEYQHRPYAGGRCTDCHNAHYAEQPRLLNLPAERLCFTCHRVGEQATMPVLHPPFAQGQCLSCHNPHATNYEKLTNLRGRQLCFTCHVDRDNEAVQPYQHPPYLTGRCTGCHSPHGAPAGKLLKQLPLEKACYNCHGVVETQFQQPSRHPVGERITCTGCHLPHASPNPRLLPARAPQFCFQCHQGKEAYYNNIGHSRLEGTVGRGSCGNCHLPHGSAFRPLLRKEEIGLCTSCHPGMYRTGFTHPVGAPYRDPAKGVILTCTTTCHDPHGTAFKHNVRKKGDGLCLTCHDMNAGPPLLKVP